VSNLNLFAIGGLSLTISCFLLVAINFLFGRKKVHVVWGLFNVSVAIWGFGAFKVATTIIPDQALFWWKINHAGVIWMPVFILHTAYFLTTKINKKVLIFAYLQAIFFQVMEASPSNLFFQDLRLVFSSFYYVTLGIAYHLFFVLWILLVAYAHIGVFKEYKASYGLKRHSLLYFLMGSALGFAGGFSNFLVGYKLDIIPIGNFTIPIYCVMVTYAIIKHRLMDIRVAITRVGIFLFVYFFVLGFPFWLGYKTGSWLLTGAAMLVLATLGPFIYSRLRREAEEILLKDQMRYQKALLRLSKNMHEVKDLDKLLRLILIQVTRHLHLKETAMYLFDKQENIFKRKTAFPHDSSLFKENISAGSDIINRLKKDNSPLLVEEFSNREQGELFSEPVSAGMLVPCTTRDELVSFIALGPKSKGLIYNELDVNIFRILSLQAGLAIENCQFWQDEKIRLAREEQIRRYNTMDNFSASLAHEIDNPVTCVIGDLFCAMEFFKQHTEEIPGSLKTEAAAAFQKNKDAFENMQRITRLTRAVREFSRENKGELTVISINEMLDEFLPLVEAQCKHSGISFMKTVEADIRVVGNKVYLADALLNLTTNAIHAIIYGDETAGIDNNPSVSSSDKYIGLKAYRKGESCVIALKDTGCGIPKKLDQDIFLDFVTTKASSVGTGMGLSRVRKIVEMHKGKVWYESEGRGKGTTFFIELPLTDKSLPEKPKRRGSK